MVDIIIIVGTVMCLPAPCYYQWEEDCAVLCATSGLLRRANERREGGERAGYVEHLCSRAHTSFSHGDGAYCTSARHTPAVSIETFSCATDTWGGFYSLSITEGAPQSVWLTTYTHITLPELHLNTKVLDRFLKKETFFTYKKHGSSLVSIFHHPLHAILQQMLWFNSSILINRLHIFWGTICSKGHYFYKVI